MGGLNTPGKGAKCWDMSLVKLLGQDGGATSVVDSHDVVWVLFMS